MSQYCLNPISLPQKIIYDTGEIVPGRNVPCGKCLSCMQKLRSQWSIRMQEEDRRAENSTFLTLTYNDENLPKDGKLSRSELQKYFKRVRYHQAKKNRWHLKYFAVGELGSKGKRPHYHAIVFNAEKEILIDSWQDKGLVQVATVTPNSIHYVTKYLIDEEKNDEPFRIMSKGLGGKFADDTRDHYLNNRDFDYIATGGGKNTLPRYIREKIFNEDQKYQAEKTIFDKKTKKMKTIKVNYYEKKPEYFEAKEKTKSWLKDQEELKLKQTFEERKYKKMQEKLLARKTSKSKDT